MFFQQEIYKQEGGSTYRHRVLKICLEMKAGRCLFIVTATLVRSRFAENHNKRSKNEQNKMLKKIRMYKKAKNLYKDSEKTDK